MFKEPALGANGAEEEVNIAGGKSGVEKDLGFLFVCLFCLFIWKRIEPPIKGQESLLCLKEGTKKPQGWCGYWKG